MPRSFVGKIALILVPLLLVAISFPLRRYLENSAPLGQPSSGKEMASVIDSEGPVFRRHKNQAQFEKVSADSIIQNNDQLRVESGGKAKVKFVSGTEIEIQENSDVVFELWREDTEDSPIYLHFLTGDYQLTHVDRARPIYVAMNDNLFLIQNKLKETARKLNVRQVPSALAQNKHDSAHLSTESEEAQKALEAQSFDGPPTNSFIDQTIASQKSLFQKCQTNSIRNQKQSKGHVTAGLTISPSGLVSEAKLLNTDFKDLELPNCAMDVIRRIKFPSYKGDEIVRSYPLQFE